MKLSDRAMYKWFLKVKEILINTHDYKITNLSRRNTSKLNVLTKT